MFDQKQQLNLEILSRVERKSKKNFSSLYPENWLQKLKPDEKEIFDTNYDWCSVENTIFCRICDKYIPENSKLVSKGNIIKFEIKLLCDDCFSERRILG